jgi:hypothetical protein
MTYLYQTAIFLHSTYLGHTLAWTGGAELVQGTSLTLSTILVSREVEEMWLIYLC